MAAINTHTQGAQCRENMLKMTTPQATAHGKERERGRENESERERRKTKRERKGARDAHQRACFIKVQVQDLSDCQVALSFWFHINVVSFLPPSPHLHCSIPHHVLLFAHFQVLPSHTHSTGNTAAKESLAETLSLAAIIFQILKYFCMETTMSYHQIKANSNIRSSSPLLVKVREAQTGCHSFLVSQLKGVL